MSQNCDSYRNQSVIPGRTWTAPTLPRVNPKEKRDAGKKEWAIPSVPNISSPEASGTTGVPGATGAPSPPPAAVDART